MGEPARAAIPSAIDAAPPPAVPAPRLEVTARALLTGCALGVVLAAGNVYTSIKVTIIDGGSITAALVAFGIFAALRRAGRAPYGVLECNLTQTVASSAAIMSFVTGVVGPIPALTMMGRQLPGIAVVLFGAGVGMLGIFAGALLRRRLIEEEALPFPTGIATGEVLETIFGADQIVRRRIRLLASAAVVSAAIFWFRDARPALIPQGFMFGGTLSGIAAATLGLGVSCSPLMLSIGAMVGVRGTLGMLLGAAVARVVLAPWLFRAGIVLNTEYGAFNMWLVWPMLGLLVAGSFLPMFLDGGAVVRAFRQLASLGRRPASEASPVDGAASLRLWAPLLAVTVAGMAVTGWAAFGMSPLITLAAVAIALVLANVSARATGETDFSPGGPVGTVGLISLVRNGSVPAIMGGSVSMGVTSQTSQMLWAFRAGRMVGASPRAQVGAQIAGMLVGAVVTVPVYIVIVASYGLGTEKMPAMTALSWKATFQMVDGLSTLPRHGATAALIGLGAGVLLTFGARRPRLGRLLPSAASIGVGFLMPFSYVLAAVVGALLASAAQRLFRGIDQPSILAVAAGGMVGESITAVVAAILMVSGVL